MKLTRPPDYTELARLAAAVSHGRKPAKAVAYALQLWQESQDASERVAVEEFGITVSGLPDIDFNLTMNRLNVLGAWQEVWQRWEKTVPKPDRFPAKLDAFLHLIVKAKTPDCDKRFRDFMRDLRSEAGSLPNGKEAADVDSLVSSDLQKIKNADKREGYFTERRWLVTAVRYLEWWKVQKSKKARESARNRSNKGTSPPVRKENR
jgi:hypothetical protein